ncbi:hypothetical protein T02_2023 [Trichinella nativa]|uniref:Uncharacterized protein n=1 Tax=Trichinella nativa TaxID=6335 RepID=A0A0V1KHG5_9BILA|nr:hypothetical protein T02_2023 [Trichinella nativa]
MLINGLFSWSQFVGVSLILITQLNCSSGYEKQNFCITFHYFSVSLLYALIPTLY